MTSYHNPVLLEESLAGLNIHPDGVYVDATFGGGGHSRAILERLSERGKLYAFDQDEAAWQNEVDDSRFVLIRENFQFMQQFLRFHGQKHVDGILADLGVSSHQFDQAERGFSTRFEGVLDMRMNQKQSLTAREVVNRYGEEELARIFHLYGELRPSRAMAKAIVDARSASPIETTTELNQVLKPFLNGYYDHKILAQVYQAIRIEVNAEMQVIESLLTQVPSILKPHGRLVVIAYHSLEDRLVKNFIRAGRFSGEPEKDMYGNTDVPLKKVGGLVVPSPAEISRNNRARSAKMRTAEKK